MIAAPDSPSSRACQAIISRLGTPATGFFSARAIPLIVANPMRMPENEPGPRATPNPSMFFKGTRVRSIKSLIINARFSRCSRPGGKIDSASTASSETTPTPSCALVECTARIINDLHRKTCYILESSARSH